MAESKSGISMWWVLGVGTVLAFMLCLLVIYTLYVYPVQQTRAALEIIKKSNPTPRSGYYYDDLLGSPDYVHTVPLEPLWVHDFYDHNLEWLCGSQWKEQLIQVTAISIFRECQLSESDLVAILNKLAYQNTLQSIHLSGRCVTDHVASIVPEFSQVQTVTLTDTDITDRGLAALATAPALKHLEVSNVNVALNSFEKLGAAKDLRSLQIRNADITAEMADALRQSKSLRKLKLYTCRISDPAMQGIARLPDLREIDLTSSDITDQGIQALATSRSIGKVVLDQCEHLTPQAFQHLAKMPQLKRLYYYRHSDSPEITEDEFVNIFLNYPSLERLRLNRIPAINDKTVMEFAKIATLRALNVMACRVSYESRSKFMKSYPHISIVH